MHMPSDSPTEYAGHPVIDEQGERLGAVTDVVYDVADRDPEYLVVDPGVFRKAHYVPVEGSYRSADGGIVVPWAKSWFKLAPKVSHVHVLTSAERHELEAHYAQR